MTQRIKLEYTPAKWAELYILCGFTEIELKIIEMYRKYGNEWTYYKYAKELGFSERTFRRKLKRIKDKVSGQILAL